MNRTIKVIVLSDTHCLHERITVPPGDVLIHCGDFSMGGKEAEIETFDAWLSTLPHPVKWVIAGNHDWLFETNPTKARSLLRNATYLEDSGAEAFGLRAWGSPWQPEFNSWAFNLPRGEALKAKWDMIPSNTDILITHGPPKGVLDDVERGEQVGCEMLAEAVGRIRPKYHVFGHVHEGYGTKSGETTFINACVVDASYDVVNEPVVLSIEVGCPIDANPENR